MLVANWEPIQARQMAIRLLRQSVPPTLRTMREFAEQEILLPTGPFEGRRFHCQRQPFTRLLLDEEDRRDRRRVISIGGGGTSRDRNSAASRSWDS